MTPTAPLPNDRRFKIGVMGSASGPQIEDPVAIEKARALGKEIGRRKWIFLNGACPGLPHEAMLAAKAAGALTIGISPAFSEREHVEGYESPLGHDIVFYTGQGFMERDIVNIRSSDAIVTIAGGVGTLNELTIAFDEGRTIGVLTKSGGISDHVQHIIETLCLRTIPPNMVFHDDPSALLDELERVHELYPLPIREDGRVVDKRTCGRGDWWCKFQGAAG